MKAKEIRRKLYAIAMAACMVSLAAAPTQAAGKAPSAQPTQPTRFTAPEILKDTNGHTYDLGGMEIIVRDWWSTDGETQDVSKSEYELARDEYLDWIQKTYHFTIKRQAISNWQSAPQDFIDYASSAPDDKNYIFVLHDSPPLIQAMHKGLFYDLSTLDCLDFSKQKYQMNLVHELYGFGQSVYAMHNEFSDQGNGVYFNKKLLRDAGINPDSIYDMQKNGMWTWENFEKLCQQVTRDTNNDGSKDIYACNCKNESMIRDLVYSNGGYFIGKNEKGKLTNGLYEEATAEALDFAQKLFDNYGEVGPEDAEWDYYREAYPDNKYVFLFEDPFWGQGLGYANILPEDWGFVMCPKGPKATDYAVGWWRNIFECIPSNYDAERAWKIAFAWDLYTDEVPGYENKEEWKNSYPTFDDRAVNETLAMLRSKGTAMVDEVCPMISAGEAITWNIRPNGPRTEDLVRNAIDKWDAFIDEENAKPFLKLLRDENGNIYDLGGIDVVVRDWYSDGRIDESTPEGRARKTYLDWIQETYNFHIVQQSTCQWSDAFDDMKNYVASGGDDHNYIFMLHSDPEILPGMQDGLFYDLSKLDCLDFSEEKFQGNLVHEIYGLGDAVYGMDAGASEPTTGIYFNKRLLSEAGIDPESIYDMQKNDTWTWEKFEELLAKVTRDVNHDGSIDVYGSTGYASVVCEAAVFSNNGRYVGREENGKFTYNLEDEESLQGLEFVKRIMDNYWCPKPADASYDYYLTQFINEEVAFLTERSFRTYNNFRGHFDSDDIGFVAFPKGPKATDYVNVWVNNAFVIPSCYDADRAWKIALAWDLYTDETYDSYERLSWHWQDWSEDYDERAAKETLPMMLNHGAVSLKDYVPAFNFDYYLYFQMMPGGPSVSEILDDCRNDLKNAIRDLNGEALLREDLNLRITKKSLTLYDNIAVEFKMPKEQLLDDTGTKYHDPYLLVTLNGKEQILMPTERDGMLVFSEMVGPHAMGDVITVEPHAFNESGLEVVGAQMKYSAKTYCYNILNSENYADEQYADLRKLCVDMLFYGEKAQKYANYKTDDLVTADLTWEQIQMGTDQSVQMVYNSVKDKEYETVSAADERAEIAAAALYLEGTVNIQFKFTVKNENLNGLRIVVTDGTSILGEYVPDPAKKDSKGRYYVNCSALNAGQMRKTVYATVMSGNKKVSNTYCYSIESYAANMVGKGNEALDYLLGAMMRYGDSAAEYVRNH